MLRRAAALLSVVVLAASAVAAIGADPVDVRALPFAFTETHLGPRSNFGEPSIAFSADDHIFICGPLKGIPDGRIAFLRSDDWKIFSATDIFDRGGGGDCHVAVGPDGAVYTANLQLWASAVRKSIDDGRTWDYQQTEDVVEQDRQWLAPDPVDPSIVYMGYHDNAAGAIVIAKSLDGARTFPLHFVASTDPALAVEGNRSTIPGPLRIDPTDHRRLYMVWAISSIQAHTKQQTNEAFRTHTIVVGRSDDGGVTWTNSAAMRAPPGALLGGIIPWISLDTAGNVYVAAAGYLSDTEPRGNGLYFARSIDGARSWSEPIRVSDGSGAAAFPTVAAGADGIVNLAWIQSSAAEHEHAQGEWRVRFAQARNGTAERPTFRIVDGPVIHRGAVCIRGLMCIDGGDRSLLDFMDMALDSFGYAHVVVTANIPGKRHVLWWRQDAGPSATTSPCVPACTPVRPGPRP